MKKQAFPTLKLFTIVVLMLGFLRATGLVLDEPVTGYANQFDMLRTSACLDFWPVTKADPMASSREAPISHYQLREGDRRNCFPGAETLIAGAAIHLADLLGQNPVDLRWIGGFKLLLLVLVAALLHWNLRRQPRAALLHAVVFAGVICDPFNMLFANSLYTEFSALLGAYMVIGSALVALLLRQFNRSLLLLWFTGLALLGGSRVQHLLLPLVLLVPVWWVMLRGKKGIWVASLVIAVMTVVLQFGLQHQYGKIDDANRINSLFYTILPTHPEPAQLAENLGIEPACAQLTNTSWYLRRGRDHRAECPGAFTLSRARLVAVLASDPITATRLFFRALHQSGAWRLPYVGEVSGVEFEKAGGFSGGSIAGLIAIMPFSVYALFYILPLWAGLWSGAWLLSRRDSEHTMFRTLVLAQALLALVILIVAMTALFGDGFSEFSRHVHLAHNACAVSWIIMPLLLFSALRQGRETRSAGPGKGLLGMIAGAVLLIILVPIGVPAMALGFGVMDEPAGETWSTAPIQLSGWAMDPNGVASVEAVVDGGRSWPLQHAPSAELAKFFPVGQSPVRFHGSLTLEASEREQVIRIWVTSKSGQKNVIERRWMRQEK